VKGRELGARESSQHPSYRWYSEIPSTRSESIRFLPLSLCLSLSLSLFLFLFNFSSVLFFLPRECECFTLRKNAQPGSEALTRQQCESASRVDSLAREETGPRENLRE